MNTKLFRSLALVTACFIAPMLARAGATDIADTPMAVTNLVKSNVLFTLDNSGGVDVDVLLPTFNSMYIEKGVTNTTASNTNGFFYLFPKAGINRIEPQYLMGFPGGSNPDPLAWRAYYYGYNAIYYNPNTTYKPWVGKDNAGNTYGNATPTAVRLDPYLASGTTYNIQQQTSTYAAETYLKTDGSACSNSGCSNETPYNTSIYPASYYIWNDANNNGVMDAGEGTLYQIKSTTTSYPSGRSYADELQNFANWFQYYRTPFLAFKGYLAQSLAIMGTTNVGVVDLDHTNPNSPVSDMSVAANVTSLQTALYSIATTPSDWTQPMHERTYNSWKYFNTASSSSNPAAPIQYACQQNFNIVVSPGYLNDGGYPTGGNGSWANGHTGVTPPSISTGNYDGTTNGSDAVWNTSPYGDSVSNTLGDWAAYYYDKTLRTDLATGQVPIPTNSRETNTNLHMSTYVLAPGAVPQLSVNNPTTALANAQTANIWAAPWSTSAFPWPTPCFVCQNTIDDMWHAAVNGRGLFINSSNIYGGLQTIVDDILDRTGAAASVAVVNANISSSNDVAYASKYLTGAWSGDLGAYTVNLTNATLSTTPVWTAQAQLDALNLSQRYIGTYNGTSGIAFTWAALGGTTGLQSVLNTPYSPPGTADGANVLSFLRGDRSKESIVYRTRDHVLGDIINSAAVVVGPPSYGYSDNGYQDFFNGQVSRATVVYQGANDGMLHAFSSTTGAELWAYVPGLLYNTRLASYSGTSSLVNLSFLQGFNHLYYVDGTPFFADVDMGNIGTTPGTANWKTILVGGLGKGGRGYYALDITSPSAGADTDVASKVLWEFPNSSTLATTTQNVGYSFGRPIVVKTKAYGWVVLVTSGYNNGSTTGGDGMGHLFVLNPSSGAVIADLSTGVGSSATPSGLAQISAYAYDAQLDATTDYVYGGDLQGNVWRFDLSGATTALWNVSKLATLVDSSGNAQPITTAPELASVSGHRMVYVGTGEYLGLSDVPGLSGSNASSTQTQTLYGLWDNKSATPVISPLRSNLVKQTLTVSGSGSSATATDTSVAAPNFSSTQMGWYVDFPGTGERMNVNMELADGALTVVTNTPAGNNPCSPGGSSFEYFINYLSGGYIANSTTSYTGISQGPQLSSGTVVLELGNGAVYSVTRLSNATNNTVQNPTPQNPATVDRIYWREILSQ